MSNNQTKIVLITGANKGIGFETSRAIARAGHTVLMGARDPERGRAAAARLAADDLDVGYLPLDVTDESTLAAAAERVSRDHGRLDVLINNAAISKDRGRAPSDLPIPDLRQVFETNTIGAAATIHHLLPLLRRSDAALIGNVSSGLGTVDFMTNPDQQLAPYTTLLAYSTSKAALNAITLIYARSLRPEGIRVVALSPGFVATDLNNNTGWDTPERGGQRIADEVLADSDETGVFFKEGGGTYPW